MLFDKYKNKMDKYLYENITFRIISIVLSIVIIFLVYIIVARTDSQKVVFVPPKIVNQEFWIAGNEVSKTYLHEMGQFITFNLLNVTKSNANNNIENILTLVDPKFYDEVKSKLLEQARYIIENSISRTFFVSSIDADVKGVIKVYGVVKDIIDSKVVRSENAEFDIRYDIILGRFFLTDVVPIKHEKGGKSDN
ncbi:TraE/TraK family type IV conjugative transfer system protein [Campylobacter sp. MIT 97-5078]|uniref:TraE/TraK family type IV conjugative transfer system protein n=1 Tax=Campylobacter sp. MIT 97-5078 TaxID=1548153 RepID=UPI000513E469|nr:TraE/TraK family type IV conjugative transfer system protein [Campylobacter sp. MIT 97-5078]KGI56037.1 conjugal transfer protein TraE [Campylobacter sp. MIT 97-5078]KGI57467.1 conjugal transfer protein TraE [Campylobacter sp. MIT 97-5078]KGI57504.1 conjugal transfer protein TraE [Campylobacter sp. MIT 97-5078]TQR27391.1 conjugal transfer protein TraE [Campylobacter sp. MIT 97-5078]